MEPCSRVPPDTEQIIVVQNLISLPKPPPTKESRKGNLEHRQHSAELFSLSHMPALMD